MEAASPGHFKAPLFILPDKDGTIILTNRHLSVADNYLKYAARRKMKMEYKAIPCTEDDEELIEGKLTKINHAVVPPHEGTEEEELVFKIENGEGAVIAGCIVGIGNW